MEKLEELEFRVSQLAEMSTKIEDSIQFDIVSRFLGGINSILAENGSLVALFESIGEEIMSIEEEINTYSER